jgi:hypothetical protein
MDNGNEQPAPHEASPGDVYVEIILTDGSEGLRLQNREGEDRGV